MNGLGSSWVNNTDSTSQAGAVESTVQWCENPEQGEMDAFYVSTVGCHVQTQGIPHAIGHLPTMLIRYWFCHICPSRSTFDSDVNYNRLLARAAWDTCEAVFYTMQATAAVCLVDSMPHLRDSVSSLTGKATASICSGVSRVRNMPYSSLRVTADLVFAVFTWGTSLHWTAATSDRQGVWLGFARELLSVWKDELSELDSLFYAYFCQAYTYWQMLETAVGHQTAHTELTEQTRSFQSKPFQSATLSDVGLSCGVLSPQSCYPGQEIMGTRPNSWCGLSNEVIDIFGQVLALCLSARRHSNSKTAISPASISNELWDLSLAHDLHTELQKMDFDKVILQEEMRGFPVLTRDESTPITDLKQTAEAYRQAALLQLHLVFRDLPLKPLFTVREQTINVGTVAKDQVLYDGFLRDSAVNLINMLGEIPASSGSRSIHLMPYLSAAAALRREVSAAIHGVDSWRAGPSRCFAFSTVRPRVLTSLDQDPISAGDFSTVAQARQCILTRLDTLQKTLPRTASASVVTLVKAVWSAYDQPQPESSRVHWLDVMRQPGMDIALW